MKRLLVAILLLGAGCTLKAQMLAVKTNALMDVAMIPNLGVEVALGNKTSVALNGMASWSIYGMKAKMYGIMPEFRYWLSGNTFSKIFVGAGASLVRYDVNPTGYEYNGDSYGFGVQVGYDMWLSRHFSVEFHGGVGLYHYSHARYLETDLLPELPEHNSRGWSVLPYQLGISLIYVIR